MAVIMIDDLPGVGPEIVEGMRQAGVLDRMKSAAGFKGHLSGTTDTGYRVIEVWESRKAWQAWFDGTIKPNLPPGAQADEPVFIDLLLEIKPG
jgi:hypothetical protein